MVYHLNIKKMPWPTGSPVSPKLGTRMNCWDLPRLKISRLFKSIKLLEIVPWYFLKSSSKWDIPMIYHDDYPIVFKWFKPSSNLMISAMIIPGFKLNFISYFVYWCMVFPKQHRMMSIVIQIDIQFPMGTMRATQQWNLPFEDGLYNPFMVILGMVYYWVHHIIHICYIYNISYWTIPHYSPQKEYYKHILYHPKNTYWSSRWMNCWMKVRFFLCILSRLTITCSAVSHFGLSCLNQSSWASVHVSWALFSACGNRHQHP